MTGFKHRLAALGGHVFRVSDALNDRFVSAGSAVGALSRRLTGLVARKSPASPAGLTEPEPRAGQEKFAARARVRLSDLHLKVGQQIYLLETSSSDDEKISQQLVALLDEIERLETVLRKIDVEAEPSTEETMAEVETFFDLDQVAEPEPST